MEHISFVCSKWFLDVKILHWHSRPKEVAVVLDRSSREVTLNSIWVSFCLEPISPLNVAPSSRNVVYFWNKQLIVCIHELGTTFKAKIWFCKRKDFCIGTKDRKKWSLFLIDLQEKFPYLEFYISFFFFFCMGVLYKFIFV